MTHCEWDLFLAIEEEMEDHVVAKEERPCPGKSLPSPKDQSGKTQALGTVQPVPRLSRDLTALQWLFSKEHPPHRLV